MAEKTYRISELADKGIIPVSSRTIRRLIAAGHLKAVNVSAGSVRQYIVTAKEVERFLKRRQVAKQ